MPSILSRLFLFSLSVALLFSPLLVLGQTANSCTTTHNVVVNATRNGATSLALPPSSQSAPVQQDAPAGFLVTSGDTLVITAVGNFNASIPSQGRNYVNTWCYTAPDNTFVSNPCSNAIGSVPQTLQGYFPSVPQPWFIAALVFRIAPVLRTSATSAWDFYPLFNASTTTDLGNGALRTVITMPPGVTGQTLFFAIWDIGTLDNSGVQFLSITQIPAVCSVINGDPQFTGLRGQSFQIHGVPGEVFSIISDEDLQYNARFVFLSSGKCPIDSTGQKVQTACYSHPGTYLGELGLETLDEDKIHLIAGPWNQGIKSITVNNVALAVGDTIDLSPSGSVKLVSSHKAIIEAGNFAFEFTNSDNFFNQAIRMVNTSATTSHGLLGQTWSKKTYKGKAVPYIEGDIDDYMMADHELFSHSFTFNRFDADCNDEQEKEENNHSHTHQPHN